MNSKTHQLFANYLQIFHNIPNQQVLNHPENYLGPNWEAVINFWIYLDTLTEEQVKVVEKRYCALSEEERRKTWNKAYKASNETTCYAWDASWSAYYNVSYADLAAEYATHELIALEKLLDQGYELVFFPMFYNFVVYAPRHLRDKDDCCVGWKHPENKKSIFDFNIEVFKTYNGGEIRKGQHIINQFTRMFPEIKVPDNADCYYDDNKIDSFYEFLWELKQNDFKTCDSQ